jgi:hypothetical protein
MKEGEKEVEWRPQAAASATNAAAISKFKNCLHLTNFKLLSQTEVHP